MEIFTVKERNSHMQKVLTSIHDIVGTHVLVVYWFVNHFILPYHSEEFGQVVGCRGEYHPK